MNPARLHVPDWIKSYPPETHTYTSYTDRSMERDQLDASIEVAEDNVAFMYGEYSATRVAYPRGSRPLLEAIVDQVCLGLSSDTEKAIALVRWRRANYRHLGKCGLGTEEEIILGGYSMCHDASRSLIMLAQVAGLGARMVLGLNNAECRGHTLTELYVDGQWALFDPSPGLPWAYLRTTAGQWVTAWDLRQQPAIAAACPTEWTKPGMMTPESYAGLFPNYRLVNYTLEESQRFLMKRFLRYAAAHHILENYDYQGHMNLPRLASYVDLDDALRRFVAGSLRR